MVRTDWIIKDKYNRPRDEVVHELIDLHQRYDNETPEMWCSRIRTPFKKILEENPRYFSKNEYIQMHAKTYDDGKLTHYSRGTNYIYCTLCDSLVFIPNSTGGCLSAHNHLMRCTAGNTVSDERAKREELLQAITHREYAIWQQKQNILQYEAEIKRIQLELSPQSQSLPHSEKDRQVSVNYAYNAISYESYFDSVRASANVGRLAESYFDSVRKV